MVQEKDVSFKQNDPVAQKNTFENVRVANSKEKVIKKAIEKIAELLRPAYGPSVVVSLNDEHLTEIDRVKGHFLGTIAVKASVPTEDGTKTIVCPVSVEPNKITLPDTELLVRRINESQGSLSQEMKDKLEVVKEKIQAITQKTKIDEEISERVAGGEDLDKVTAEVRDGVKPVKKESKEYEYSDGQGGVIDRAIGDVPATLHINKAMLPAAVAVGDTINITGYRYKVSGSSPALSSGADDGSQWLLTLLIQTE